MNLFRRERQSGHIHSRIFGVPKTNKKSSQNLVIQEIKPKDLMKNPCFCNFTCENVNQFFPTPLNLQGLSRGNAQDSD